MTTREADRPAPSAEGVLAAVVFAVVSLLLIATLPLPSERGAATTSRDATAAAASGPAGRP